MTIRHLALIYGIVAPRAAVDPHLLLAAVAAYFGFMAPHRYAEPTTAHRV